MQRLSKTSQQVSKGTHYQIRIGQHLDPECSAWLSGLAITNLESGEAILTGLLADQAALYGVLQWLRDMNIPLIDIRREN